MDNATKQAISSIGQCGIAMCHILRQSSNSWFVTRWRSSIAGEILANRELAQEIVERAQFHQRQTNVNIDPASTCGHIAFPKLPVQIAAVEAHWATGQSF
jgi:hypothetical protein